MAKYTVSIPYIGWKDYEVEAENKKEAIEKTFEENEIEANLSLCWHCSKETVSELAIDEEHIYAEQS